MWSSLWVRLQALTWVSSVLELLHASVPRLILLPLAIVCVPCLLAHTRPLLIARPPAPPSSLTICLSRLQPPSLSFTAPLTTASLSLHASSLASVSSSTQQAVVLVKLPSSSLSLLARISSLLSVARRRSV